MRDASVPYAMDCKGPSVVFGQQLDGLEGPRRFTHSLVFWWGSWKAGSARLASSLCGLRVSPHGFSSWLVGLFTRQLKTPRRRK